jgi:hypothetical protein
MSLITEDGTGRADAESLCSVADASAYHLARGNSAWAALASDTLREQALRKATDYMAAYRARWAGYRVSSAQALDWPRYEVPMRDVGGDAYYPSDAVPAAVRNACAELALRSLTESLAPDMDAPTIREKVGPIEVERAQGARQTKRFTAVDMMLAPFLCGSSNSMRVSRA